MKNGVLRPSQMAVKRNKSSIPFLLLLPSSKLRFVKLGQIQLTIAEELLYWKLGLAAPIPEGSKTQQIIYSFFVTTTFIKTSFCEARYQQKSRLRGLDDLLRRMRDSNPRYVSHAYTLSKRAP